MLEKCAGLTYKIEYQEGIKNKVADAMSRAPFVETPVYNVGIVGMLNSLLSRLDKSVRETYRFWVWADKDTAMVSRLIKDWREDTKNVIITSAPNKASYSAEWDMAVLIPSGDRAPSVCESLLKSGKPFACLVPSDLVSWIALDMKQQRNMDVQARLDAASKFSSLDENLTWIVSSTGSHRHEIFVLADVEEEVNESMAAKDEAIVCENKPDVGDIHQDWPAEQAREEKQLRAEASGHVTTIGQQLLVELKEGERAKILVPAARRVALIKKTHEASLHHGWKKTLTTLRNTFAWKGMSSQVKRVVESCVECAQTRGRRNLAHGQFSSVIHDGPRRAYSFDFYGVAKSQAGHHWILTVMDLCSREVLFIPCFTRTAEELVRNLLHHVVYVKGVPELFMSDEAKEFTGKLVAGLCSSLGIQHITTKGYDARRNAVCERVHGFLGNCLVRLPEDRRPFWDQHLTEFSFAHNTVVHESLGFTPFEIGHGSEARTPVSAAAVLPSGDRPEDADDNAKGYYGRLKEAAALYRQLARDNLKSAQDEQNSRLNAGSRKIVFELGTKVSIYFPRHAVESDWKVKHITHWRGPMTVVERPTNTTYVLKEDSSGQVFQRSVTNIKKYKAAGERDPGAKVAGAENFLAGDMVATRDTTDSKEFWIAKVISVDADSIKCHFWATRGVAMKKAVYKPAYIGDISGKTILAYKLGRNEEACKPWTGIVPMECIITKVKLGGKESKKLKPASQKLLDRFLMARL